MPYRVPTDDQHASVVSDYNLLLPAGVALVGVALLWRRSLGANKLGMQQVAMAALLWLGCVAVLLGMTLEVYYMAWCPLPEARLQATWDILQGNMQVLEASGLNYALAEGSLLPVVRGNAKLNPWDQDTDTFVEMENAPTTEQEAAKHEGLQKLMADTRAHFGDRAHVVYVPERCFVQVHMDGAHGDMWLWSPESPGSSVLHNPDYSFGILSDPYRLQRDWLFPSEQIEWAGMSIRIPNKPDVYLTSEYGPNYMTPYLGRLMCAESMAVGRAAESYMLLALVSIALPSALIGKALYDAWKETSKGGPQRYAPV